MKVFEVIEEYEHGKDKEIIQSRKYVISHDDNIKTVTENAAEHCFQYEKELISVRYILTVTEKIEPKG